jgi:hypothetical protein
MDNATGPAGELFVAHFLVVCDQDRSGDFYRPVSGAEVLRDRVPEAGRRGGPAPDRARPAGISKSGIPPGPWNGPALAAKPVNGLG